MKKPYAIHWFRRDLRVSGNEILDWSRQRFNGRVLGLFCFDKLFLSRKDFSHNRFQFFLETLKSLKKELRKMGGDLLLLDTGPQEAFEKLFKLLKKEKLELPTIISWNRDYEPFALKRDRLMISFFKKMEISTYNGRDHLILEPHEISKGPKGEEGYKVYTPFYNKWIQKFEEKLKNEDHRRRQYCCHQAEEVFSYLNYYFYHHVCLSIVRAHHNFFHPINKCY